MKTLNDYCERFEELNASTETINEAREAFVNTILNGIATEIDLPYFIDVDTIEDTDFDEIYSVITDRLSDSNAFDQDIIYYSTAMDFLSKNDPSLQESLELAHNLGYEAKNLNSEILASLLATELCREEWGAAQTEIENNVEDAQNALKALLEELEAQAEEAEEDEEE